MAIKKGDRVSVPDAAEPKVASRDEYNSRVWVEIDGKEEPYLILPDGALVRDYQHGFPDK